MLSLRINLACKQLVRSQVVHSSKRNLAAFSFPWKKKNSETASEIPEGEKRSGSTKFDDFSQDVLNKIASKKSLVTNRNEYKPPHDVGERIKRIVSNVMTIDDDNWQNMEFPDNAIKFKVLSAMITEFQHDIPCASLTNIKTIGDAYEYFLKEVRLSVPLEDMSKLNLPPNLSIQLEAIRFDANRDTFFDGINAFPGREGQVTSIKYKRKYHSIKNSKPEPGYANIYYEDYRQ